ncbi:MAG TPA: hypothetical protein ACHBX0_13685 [Arsenophonus sp.]
MKGYNIYYHKTMLAINNEQEILLRFNNIVNYDFIIFNMLNCLCNYAVKGVNYSGDNGLVNPMIEDSSHISKFSGITQPHDYNKFNPQTSDNNKDIFQQPYAPSTPPEKLMTDFQNVKHIISWKSEYRQKYRNIIQEKLNVITELEQRK